MAEVLSRFTFPKEWGFRRTPIRPRDLWVFDFEENYDWDTVWNDAVQIRDDAVVLIGPPLYQVGQWLREHWSFYDNTGKKLEWQITEMDRVCMTVVKTNGLCGILTLAANNGSIKHSIRINQASGAFGGKKVIVTISKDHPVSWLKQWIDYHKVVHNLDGLLLYNNQSKIYTSDELEAELQRSDMTIKVVDYDVPFGCMGGGLWEWNGKRGDHLPWDSDFSQYVMLEHAKWRYLHCAKLVINADTDELLYIKNNTLDGMADICMSSNNSVWLYKGTWIEPVSSISGHIAEGVPFDQRRFNEYWHTSYSNQRGIGVKWMLNPQKNMQYQWMLHRTTGPHMMTDDIGFAHYLAMNTSWSWKRDSYGGNFSDLQVFSEMTQNLHEWNKHHGRT